MGHDAQRAADVSVLSRIRSEREMQLWRSRSPRPLSRRQDKPFEMQTLEIDEPGPGEVLVRVAATGVCHAEGLARHGDLPFPFPRRARPRRRRHCRSCRRWGQGLCRGRRVVIGWPSCGNCRDCQAGEPRYCRHLGELLIGGTRHGGATALHRPDGSAVSSHFFGQSSFATYALTTPRPLVGVRPDVRWK